jgi:hypothetical protein
MGGGGPIYRGLTFPGGQCDQIGRNFASDIFKKKMRPTPKKFAQLVKFSRYMIPKPGKMYQMGIKYPKYPLKFPNGPKIYQHFPI